MAAGGQLIDPVHLAAIGLKPCPVVRGAVQADVVEGIDPKAVALVQDLADPVMRVPLVHGGGEIVVVGEPVKRVGAKHHPADPGSEEPDLRHFDFGGRPWRRRRLALRLPSRYGRARFEETSPACRQWVAVIHGSLL